MSLRKLLLRKFSRAVRTQPKQMDKRKPGRLLKKTLLGARARPIQPASALPVSRVPPLPRTPESGLTIRDLIRPDAQLQSSMEGFFLDQRSEHTRRAYGKDLKRFIQFLHFRQMSFGPEPLTRTVIIAYKESLIADGLEHTTVDRHLATLRSFFKWLVADGRLDRSPAENVRFLKPRRVSKTIGFTDDEVVRMLAVANLHTRTGCMHQAILAMLFYCGLRRSEVCELRTAQLGVERSHPILRVRGKGNTERIIPLVPEVWHALLRHLRMTGKEVTRDEFLFSPIRNNRTQIKEKPLDSSMIYYLVKKYARAAGVVNRVSPHSCRATAISNARDHQVSDRAIQEFAGWSTPNMITRYDKRKTAIEQSAAHAIDYTVKRRVPVKVTE